MKIKESLDGSPQKTKKNKIQCKRYLLLGKSGFTICDIDKKGFTWGRYIGDNGISFDLRRKEDKQIIETVLKKGEQVATYVDPREQIIIWPWERKQKIRLKIE